MVSLIRNSVALISLSLGCGGSAKLADSTGTPDDAGAPLTNVSGGTCQAFAPCTGNLAGKWKLVQLCEASVPNLLKDECPFATQTETPGGNVEFGSSGSVVSELTLALHGVVPEQCVPELGGCGTSGGLLEGCVNSMTDCECAVSTGFDLIRSGNFDVQGDSVTITAADDGTSRTFQFCQSGTRLRMAITTADSAQVLDFAADQ